MANPKAGIIVLALVGAGGYYAYTLGQEQKAGPVLSSLAEPYETAPVTSESGTVFQPWQITATAAQQAALIESAVDVVVADMRTSEVKVNESNDPVTADFAAKFTRRDAAGKWEFSAPLLWSSEGWKVDANASSLQEN